MKLCNMEVFVQFIRSGNLILSPSLSLIILCRMFYGPGGPYALFAGRDASRALALLSFDARDLTGNIEGLGEPELEVLQDWEYKFMEKYVKVGQIVPSGASTDVKDKSQ